MGVSIPGMNTTYMFEGINSPRFRLIRIETLVLFAIAALFLLLVFGSYRRRSSSKAVKLIVFAAYIVSYTLVSYTTGLMQSSPYGNSLFVVWAMCLMLVLGSVDSLSAYDLQDNDNWKRFYILYLVQCFWAGWLIGAYGGHSNFKVPLWVIFSIAIWSTITRMGSFEAASKYCDLSYYTKFVADYMGYEHELEDAVVPNPITMHGYRYVVAGEDWRNYIHEPPDYFEIKDAEMSGSGDSAGDAEGDLERLPSAIPRSSPPPFPSSTSSPVYSPGRLLDPERPLPAAFVESARITGLDVQEACESTEGNCNRQGQSASSQRQEARARCSSSPAKGSPVGGTSLSDRDNEIRGSSDRGNDLRGFSSQSEVKSDSVLARFHFFGSGFDPASRDSDPVPSKVIENCGSASSAKVAEQIAATSTVSSKPLIRSNCFVPGRGCQIRPWKGPLPKRKPSEITLEAYLPSCFVNRGASLEEAVSDKNQDSPFGRGPSAEYSRAALIERARVYGASRDFTPRLGPRVHRLLVEPRTPTKPTYAAMASRPPAPDRQLANHRPPPQFQARPPMQRHVPPPARQRPTYRQPPFRPPAGQGFRPGRGFSREGLGPPRRNLPQGRGRGEDHMSGQGAPALGVPAESQQGQDGSAPADTAKAKKPRPPHCFRCKTNGHLAEGCKANLDCIICNKKNSHLAAKCPILKMPRPGASMFGFAKAGLCFYRLPDFDFKLEEPEQAPTALVKISGGTLPAAMVQEELAKLSRLDWNWEALPHDDDSFLDAFPSEEELLRMADVEFRLKTHGVTLLISTWRADGDAVPAYQLDEVWVHISGVPHAWRYFLGFWGLGAAIGLTLDVDMLTYRRKGVIRILVGMLDKSLLPLKPDIVFGKVGYDITFTLENEDFEPAVPDPVDFDSLDRNGNGAEDQNAGRQGGNQLAKKTKAN